MDWQQMNASALERSLLGCALLTSAALPDLNPTHKNLLRSPPVAPEPVTAKMGRRIPRVVTFYNFSDRKARHYKDPGVSPPETCSQPGPP